MGGGIGRRYPKTERYQGGDVMQGDHRGKAEKGKSYNSFRAREVDRKTVNVSFHQILAPYTKLREGK